MSYASTGGGSAAPEEAQPEPGQDEASAESDSAKASKADGVESPEVASLRVQLRATEAEADELAATNRTLTTQLKAVLQTAASRKASVDRDAQLEAAKHQVVKECAAIAHRPCAKPYLLPTTLQSMLSAARAERRARRAP